MTQYIVTTVNGKIAASAPTLPISDEDLHWVNNECLGRLYEGLQTKIPNLVNCQVLAIHPTEDIVEHLVVQL